MRSIMLFVSSAVLALAGLCSCGGSDLDSPQSLAVTTFAAGQPFRLSFTMTTCSDRCLRYQSSDCTASVESEINIDDPLSSRRVITANPKADVVSEVSDCNTNECGQPVAAFCEVPALEAGSWTVKAGDFTGSILIQ